MKSLKTLIKIVSAKKQILQEESKHKHFINSNNNVKFLKVETETLLSSMKASDFFIYFVTLCSVWDFKMSNFPNKMCDVSSSLFVPFFTLSLV